MRPLYLVHWINLFDNLLISWFLQVYRHPLVKTLPRSRDNVCFFSVIVCYWAKPWLMRRSTVDKPGLAYFWFCRHLPRFVTVFTQSRPQSPRYPCPAERENEVLWENPFWITGVLTIYKNHPVGNFRHKHKTIKCEVAGVGITIEYIHIS